MLPFLTSALSAIGSIFGAIFQTKAAKMEAIASGVSGTIGLLKQVNATDGEIATAVSAVVAAEAQSESILARNWRPVCMLLIVVMIISFMWGYTPPNINGAMPPMLAELFEILKIGLCGYIPGRSLEKIVKTIMTPKIVEQVMKQIGGAK